MQLGSAHDPLLAFREAWFDEANIKCSSTCLTSTRRPRCLNRGPLSHLAAFIDSRYPASLLVRARFGVRFGVSHGNTKSRSREAFGSLGIGAYEPALESHLRLCSTFTRPRPQENRSWSYGDIVIALIAQVLHPPGATAEAPP
jgi:hypothetical protein